MDAHYEILILEDDTALSNGITAAFRDDNYHFTQCSTINAAEAALDKDRFDLLILDVNLPDGNGVSFCQGIRQKQIRTPIILMTVKDLETDIVYGLEAGADDYITKPFTLMVLRARVHALLRRSGFDSQSSRMSGQCYNNEKYSFNFQTMIFTKEKERIELSKTEQRLLYLLISNPNQIMKRELLVDRLWTDGSEYVDENALSVTVKRLRDKLEDIPSRPVYIKTAYGLGYKWEEL